MDDEVKKKDTVKLPSGKTMSKKTWIMAGLRRMCYRWPPRAQAERNARVERGRYRCAMCKELFRAKEYHIDHIESVVPVIEGFPIHPTTGGPDWTIIIERMFCDLDNWQILCCADHDLKSSLEDNLRSSYAAERKVDKKKKI